MVRAKVTGGEQGGVEVRELATQSLEKALEGNKGSRWDRPPWLTMMLAGGPVWQEQLVPHVWIWEFGPFPTLSPDLWC